MGDFTPRFKPGHAVTFTASAAVTGGQLVEVSGNMQVAPATAGSQKVVGQPGHDALAGEPVTVHTPGKTVTTAVASGAIAAGDPVKAAAAGKVTKFVVGTDADLARFGTALEGVADGQSVRVIPA